MEPLAKCLPKCYCCNQGRPTTYGRGGVAVVEIQLASQESLALQDRIRRYYRETAWQYRLVWSREHLHYGYYDERARTHRQALVRMLEVMADAAGIQPGMRALDAGCGVGGASRWLARDRGCRVVGITLVPEQVSEAQRLAKQQGLPQEQVRFLVADYTATPFRDGEFDAVWALESSCYAEPKEAFLREAWRVLKPGGVLVVADFYRTYEHGSSLTRAWEESWAMPTLQTPGQWLDSLASVGFSVVAHKDLTRSVYPSVRRLLLWGLATYPLLVLAPWTPRVPAANIRSALLQAHTFERREACYCLTVAQKS
jgi:tocopherol O-methyltransferase